MTDKVFSQVTDKKCTIVEDINNIELPKDDFDHEKAYNLFINECFDRNGKPLTDYKACKEYYMQYVYPTLQNEYYVWFGVAQEFVVYDKTTFFDVFTAKVNDIITKWMKKENRKFYSIVSDSTLPRVIGNKLNMSKGLLHKANKKYKDYDENIKKKVDIFIKFMLDVLCSGNDESLKYILKWLAYMCRGKKNKSCLYLKGPQGIGKSTFLDFIINYVVGFDVCQLADAEMIKSSNNKLLLGKLFAYFEELPTFSENDWKAIDGKLKHMITGDTLLFSEKFERKFTAVNSNNYIIVTNVNAIKSSDGRRYFILDLSSQYRENHEYFNYIISNCYNKEVGEAFFMYLMDIDLTNYEAQKDMPMTKAKQNAIIDLMDNSHKFIKEMYFLKKKGIKEAPTELYKQYCDWCNVQYIKSRKRNDFFDKLKEINIIYKSGHGNKNMYSVDASTLYEIGMKYKWLHELDEFDNENHEQKQYHDVNDKNDNELKDLLHEALKNIEDKDIEINKLKNQIKIFEDMMKKNEAQEVETIKSNESDDIIVQEKQPNKKKPRKLNNFEPMDILKEKSKKLEMIMKVNDDVITDNEEENEKEEEEKIIICDDDLENIISGDEFM